MNKVIKVIDGLLVKLFNIHHPLAELNQRIFDSSNGFVVNKVNIL